MRVFRGKRPFVPDKTIRLYQTKTSVQSERIDAWIFLFPRVFVTFMNQCYSLRSSLSRSLRSKLGSSHSVFALFFTAAADLILDSQGNPLFWINAIPFKLPEGYRGSSICIYF